MFLIEKFQQFYAEVLRMKAQVSEGGWAFESDAAAVESRLTANSAGTVFRRLLSVLQRQAEEAGRNGGDVALAIYRRAQYAMAALADEIFLNLDWQGKELWRSTLLESRVFASHHAGEELFSRIEELLHDHDASQAELARVYLMVLALGFQGKYRGKPDAEEEIAVIRHRLHRFIFGRDPQAVRGAEHLVPQAYLSVIDRRPAQLAHMKPWLWAVAAVLVLWLGLSHLLWRSTTNDLTPLVDEILAAPASPADEVSPAAVRGDV
ncbi:MAG TPA: DotU family type IV/VI secretion system protein [Thermoanaerobaculia bacterium]|jgi:type VI secretion system protein ImpK